MTRLSRHRFGLILATLAWTWQTPLNGLPPTATAVAAKAPLQALLSRCLDLEKDHHWQQAADLYEKALRLHGEQSGLRQRWRLAEQRFNLSRRYHDVSFTHEMLTLTEDRGLALLQEVLRKIQAYYVEPVDFDRLAQAGYQHLRVALTEPFFVESNIKPEARAILAELQTKLENRPARSILTLAAAVEEVREAGRICQPYFQRPVAVTLEFLSAACENLDPYSAHLTPNRLRDLYAMIDGNFVGLGVEVRGEKDGLRVANVLPGSPAEEGQLHEGDLITRVDDRQLANLPSEEAANTLQGSANTTVRLEVHPLQGVEHAIMLVRREVVVHSITAHFMLDRQKRIGYIRLASFQKLTLAELRDAVDNLVEAEGMEALILDLRGNPGGLLDVAVQVANQFIPAGVVVRTRGRAWGQSWDHEARAAKVWGFPLALLVDADSASASEILAGAIKDYERGVIVGTRTYGKGSVQSIFPLQSVSTGLRLTTARFFSPKDKPYESVGVEPDVVVARASVVGTLCEEAPVSRLPTLNEDPQLREAHRCLTDGALRTARREAVPIVSQVETKSATVARRSE